MKNKKVNIFFIVIVTVLVLFLALKDNFAEKIFYLFAFNPWWLLLAFVFMFLYWFLKALVIYYCSRRLNNNYKFGQAFKLLLDTQFVNGITPFCMGGQPYQVYRLKKQGFSIEQGTNIVIQDFIVYQIALILLGSIAVISNYCLDIFPSSSLLKHLVLIGYLINFCVILFLFTIAFNRKGNKFLLNFFVKIGYKLHLIKDKDLYLKKVDLILIDFHNSASLLMKSKLHFIKIIIFNFLALVLLYMIPFTLIKGLSLNLNPFIVVVSSAYVMLIGSFVPIPGGSGGLEFGFVSFFGNYITGVKLSSIMLAWRFITYYLGLLVGAFCINIKEAN